MNATTTVISVNPGKATVGSLHPEAAGIFRRRILGTQRNQQSPVKGWLNAFFGMHGNASKQMWKGLAALRIGFAMILSTLMLTDAIPEVEGGMQVALWCVAVALASGTFTRFASVATAACFGYSFILSAAAGAMDTTSMFCFFLALMTAWMGPGMMSADTILRSMLFRRLSTWGRERRNRNIRLSYRAYSSFRC